MKMKIWSLVLALLTQMPSLNSYSQSITDYQNCTDYFGGVNEDNNPVNVEFMNRIFGTNYTSIPGSCGSCNPGLITDNFLGCRKTTCGDAVCTLTNTHKGLDIRSAANTNVYAPLSGTIRNVDASCGGRLVIEDDSDPNLKFYFLHMNTISVSNGMHVSMGDIVGQSGVKYAYTNSSGQIVCSTVAEHLHAEIRSYSSNAPKAQSTCVACTDNYDPRLIVLLHPRAREVNDRLDIYAGSVSNKKQIKVWFRLPGINNGTFTVQNCYVGSYDVSQNIISKTGCNGVGQFTIDFPNVTTNSLANTTYDIRFEINGSANKFQGFNQVYLLDPDNFTDIPSQDIWHFPYVRFGIEEGFFKGISLGNNQYKFDGAGLVTRGQAAKVVFMAANKLHLLEVDITGNVLQNLSPTHWAFPFMQTLFKNGVISDGRPDDLITTGQFAKMLVNALSLNINDENDNTLNNGNGRTQSNSAINSSDQTLQQYLEIVNKIMLYTSINNSRGYLEPAVNGLLCVSNSQLNGSLVTAVGSNTLSRDLMAKTIVNIYKYKKDKIGNYQPCYGGPQFLNIFNNNFSKFTVIGDKFELTSTPTGSINLSSGSASLDMEAGEVKDFGLDDDVLNGYNLHFYWCVDSGQLVSLYPNNNHKKVRFTAPNVTAPTPVTLYLYIGCGNGMAKEAIYNITVYPQGQVPQPPASEPTQSPTTLGFSNTSYYQTDENWTTGNGDYTLVTYTPQGSTVHPPVDGDVYTVGSTISGNTKVTYNSTGSTDVTGNLQPGTTYQFRAYSFNGNTTGSTNYKTTSPASGNVTTLVVPPFNADFYWDDNPVIAGQSVEFTNTINASGINESWTFQGGSPSTSTLNTPDVTFAAAGTYLVTLTATNTNTNQVSTVSKYVTVLAANAVNPDFVVSNLSLPATTLYAGQSGITTNITFSNIGLIDGQVNNYRIYLSSNNVYDAGDTQIGIRTGWASALIPPGQSLATTHNITIPGGTATGSWYILVYADFDNTVAESNEANNVGSIQVTVEAGLPDFTYTALALSRSTVATYDTLTITSTLKNQGFNPPGGSSYISTNIYISSNNTWEATDTLLSDLGLQVSFNIPYSNQSENLVHGARIPPTVKSGNYYMIITADIEPGSSNDNMYAELNETNNYRAIPITIANPTQPTIAPTNIQVLNITPTTCRIAWTNGNGAKRMVVLAENQTSFYWNPPIDKVSYTANSNYSLAGNLTTIAVQGKIVFSNTGSFVDVTNLAPNTTYTVNVFEYNGSGSTSDYLLENYLKPVLFKTADTSQVIAGWRAITNSPTNNSFFDFHDIQFVNDSTGYACSNAYGILASTKTSGSYWQLSSRDASFESVHFANTSSGIAGGTAYHTPSIYSTSNGGTTWTKANFPNVVVEIHEVYMLTTTNWFVVGLGINPDTSGYLYRTTDGGNSFQLILNAPTSLRSIDFVSASQGFIAGGYRKVYKTTDGGNTWQLIYSGNNKRFKRIDFVDAVVGYAVSQDSVYKTTNGGYTWIPLAKAHLGGGESWHVNFYNANTGYVTTNSGEVAKTADGGATWTYFSGSPFCIGSCSQTYAASTLSENKVWLAGDWIYYSETGGLTYGIDKPTLSLNPICTGFSMQVGFTKTGTFNAGNVFTVQLSDSAGNFDAPLTLGTLASVNGGTVTVGIPNGVKESSTYRIRVVSSNPVATSTSSNNLTVYQKPVPSISVLLPTQYYLNSSPVTLSSYGNPGGGYFTINSNTVTTLNPASLGVGTHTVRYNLANGPCLTFAEKTITVIPAPLITITQPTPTTVCPGSNISFNYTSTSINAGNTFSVQLSDKNGSFTNPTTIYTLSGNSTSGSIAAAIPVTAVKGNGYRIRMTANSPSVTSSVSITFTVDTLLVPSVSLQATPTAICAGQSVTFTTSTQNAGSTPQYQWFLNNLPTGTNSSSYTISTLNNQDEVSLTLTSSAQCALPAIANSTQIAIQVNPTVTPAVYIIADDTGFCSGSAASFAAYSSNEGNSPTYQWKVNGIVAGSNTAYFSSTSLTNGNKVSVTLTSSEQCLTTPTATDSLYANILPAVIPTISIAKDNPNNCNNQLTNFIATTTNAGNNPVFVWKNNGNIVGTNSNTYDNVFLLGGEAITCQLTSSLCASPNPVLSNTINVPATNSPAVIGFPQGASASCVGDTTTYTASAGGSTSITWSVNNGTIISGQGTTSVSVLWQLAGNNTVTVVGTNICGSAIVNQQKTVSVGAESNITIATNNTTVCENTSPVFTATVTSPATNPVYQWKLNGVNVGSNANTYTLSNPATGNIVSCVFSSTNVCSAIPADTSNTITITTVPAPSTVLTMNPPVWCGNNPTYLQVPACAGCTHNWSQTNVIPFIGSITVPITGNTNAIPVSTINQSGVVTINITVTNSSGCSATSSTLFTATQLPNSFNTITASTCQNTPYNFHGTLLSTTGSFNDTLQSANGCDSVVTLNLTVLPVSVTTIAESICAGSSYFFKGQNIFTAGNYSDTLTSSNSCDSIINLTLTVNNPSPSSINASICQGSSYLFNNQNLTIAGTYTDTLLNSFSCDSIVTLNLSVDVPPVKPIITVIGDTAFCLGDSAILQTANAVGTLLWNTNETTPSITVISANAYNVQVTNQCGNAMSDNQQISVFSLPTQPAIVQNADTLTSNVLANSYQWYYNQSVINGAITQSIVASQNGNYVVEITNTNGCKNTSVAYNYSSVGLNSLSIPFSVQIIPNPNTGQFTIQFSDNTPHNISITDVLGRLLTKETVTGGKQITNQNWADGIYFLNVISPNQTASLKFIIAK